MSAISNNKLQELLNQREKMKAEGRAKIAGIKEQQKKREERIVAAIRTAKRLAGSQQRKADDHAKVLVGVAAIGLAQQSAEFRAALELQFANFYGAAPSDLAEAKRALGLTVVKPTKDKTTV